VTPQQCVSHESMSSPAILGMSFAQTKSPPFDRQASCFVFLNAAPSPLTRLWINMDIDSVLRENYEKLLPSAMKITFHDFFSEREWR